MFSKKMMRKVGLILVFCQLFLVSGVFAENVSENEQSVISLELQKEKDLESVKNK